MSLFRVTIGVGHRDGGDLIEVLALVDTGALHTMLPESLLTQLRVQPLVEQSFEFGDGYAESLGVGLARIAWQDKEFPCPVIFGPEDKYLMGATTLEALNLMVDPSRHKLVPFIHPERPYLGGRQPLRVEKHIWGASGIVVGR